MDRYNRHIILSEIGQKGQDKLSNAKVLVVGAGGLGCPVLQYLAAAGVGNIGIIDFDVVEKSNLQRQILFGSSSLGKNKAEAAKMRLLDLNDSISINAYPEKLTYQNALDLFNQYDIIVDGTDNFETRYLINDACILTNKPLVFGAIYKFQGQVSVFNHKNGPSYRCAFPNKPKRNSVPNCSEVGVLGILPGIIGNLQANEVLKIILGIGNLLSGKLLFYDALTNQITTLTVKRNDTEIQKIISIKNDFKKVELNQPCEVQIIDVSIKDIINKKNIQFIDVRELYEQPEVKGLNVTKIPLSVLEDTIGALNKDKDIAVFCQVGIRSKTAVSILKNHNIQNCYNLKEGVLEINEYLNRIQKQETNG